MKKQTNTKQKHGDFIDFKFKNSNIFQLREAQKETVTTLQKRSINESEWVHCCGSMRDSTHHLIAISFYQNAAMPQ